ncbi:MAG TPA: 3-phosphoshikimate 1-carboxyvinyltransferase [Flammeovirgaceae bacterium]|nr:3-phosphoshikimate 1-carboxyvinyltransferase [Flammeovirgaceae bacterium]
MTVIHLHKSQPQEAAVVNLPGSKSESNRALLINALCPQPGTIANLSPARDTAIMQKLLAQKESDYNARDAGTVMRFMTAWLAIKGRPATITGSPRMLERPIAPLVEALQQLGANITYLGRKGFPPLQFNGFERQLTGHLHIDSSLSSQYISALLMIAPLLPEGLTLHLTGTPVSMPYIDMTISLMQHFGVTVQHHHMTFTVPPQAYRYRPFTVEADWSAASYWYALFALSDKQQMVLRGLKESSRQGDRVVAQMMQDFGVTSTWQGDDLILGKKPAVLPHTQDFINCPDLAQTFAVLCAAWQQPCTFRGLQTLKIKETDRVAALHTELQKLGGSLEEKQDHWLLQPFKNGWQSIPTPTIATYHDHRMAMAFAPLVSQRDITIAEPDVVAKSYPGFWQDLRNCGIEIEQL